MEEPSADFLKLRDYVDALDCRNLSAFSPENLRSGFSDKMVQQARDELKINKVKNDVKTQVQGRSQDFSKGGQRQGHHPGIAGYIWFIPLLSLVYQRAQSYYRGMKAHIN